MIFQILKNIDSKEIYTNWADCWECAHKETFSPVIHTLFITNFKIKGKNYKERKENARTLAIEIQRIYINYDICTSYCDTMQFSSIFERIGKNYGLLKEYKENSII